MANWAQKPGGWNCRRGRVAGIAAGAGWLELSPGYLGGVIPQRPLVIPEVFAADPGEGQDDQPGHRLLASPGAGQRQGEERRDRVVAGKLLVSAPHDLYSLIEATEVTQGAAVLDQAPAQAVAVQARREGLLVYRRRLRLAARKGERARVFEQRVGVAGMLPGQIPEVADRGLGIIPPGGRPPSLDRVAQRGHAGRPFGCWYGSVAERGSHIPRGPFERGALDAQRHDAARAYADPGGAEPERGAQALADILAALGVGLRVASYLDKTRPPIVHDHRYLWPALCVAEFLGSSHVGKLCVAADDERLRLRIVEDRHGYDVRHAIGPDGGEAAEPLIVQVRDFCVGENAHAHLLCLRRAVDAGRAIRGWITGRASAGRGGGDGSRPAPARGPGENRRRLRRRRAQR